MLYSPIFNRARWKGAEVAGLVTRLPTTPAPITDLRVPVKIVVADKV